MQASALTFILKQRKEKGELMQHYVIFQLLFFMALSEGMSVGLMLTVNWLNLPLDACLSNITVLMLSIILVNRSISQQVRQSSFWILTLLCSGEHTAAVMPGEHYDSEWVVLFKQLEFRNDNWVHGGEAVCCITGQWHKPLQSSLHK